VLTADLVNARRRGAELTLVSLGDDSRARAEDLAVRLITAVTASVGRKLEEVTAALEAVTAEARDYKTKDGLEKLLTDRCDWGAATEVSPEDIRREVFTLASTMRAALEAGEQLDREAVLEEIARRRELAKDALEQALFSDLRGAQLLLRFEAISARELVMLYERGQAQAVLLRAVKIAVEIQAASAGATRAFFRRLKFLQLLHVITKTDEGYKVVIDGPFSLFESVTKYGQKLALVLPALEGCDSWRLVADIRWGKEKRPLVFRMQHQGATPPRKREPPLPEEVAALLRTFTALGTAWKASPKTSILDLPGVGLTVPDLVFEREGAEGKRIKVYLEVMGYWSRAAVWQRVELVRAGLAERVLFAVSSRLRVSEEVLGDDLPGALYVYKGTMSARVVAERLDALWAREG